MYIRKKKRNPEGKHNIRETEVGMEVEKNVRKYSQLLTAKYVHRHEHAQNTESKQWTIITRWMGEWEGSINKQFG